MLSTTFNSAVWLLIAISFGLDSTRVLPNWLSSWTVALMVILASMVLFELPMRGSWMGLLVAVSLFLVGALGTGLFVSTVAETQQVAFQMSLLLAYLPTLMLSGFIFPISSMPWVLQGITYLVPARYFLVALRGIVLKGTDLSLLGVPLVAMTIYAAGVLALASLRFARQHG